MDRSIRLTAASVKTVKRPGRYGDKRAGHGLSLLVKRTRNGGLSKTWSQRLRDRTKAFNVGLGAYPCVSLQQAREAALENVQAMAQGKDPRLTDRIPTFAEAAAEVIALYGPFWKTGAPTEAQWRRTLENYAFPSLGTMPVNEIEVDHVLGVLQPIQKHRQPTAVTVRRMIRRVLGWCQAYGHVTGNVADSQVDAALPSLPSDRTHHRALPYDDLPAALAAAAACGSRLSSRLCFRFLVLTAARSEEAREARWSEISAGGREWLIPGERMKNGVEHRQPLCRPALAVLEEAKALDDGSGLVFPSSTGSGKPMDRTTLTDLLKKVGVWDRTTVHGLRSTFRDWAGDRTNADHAVMELSLAHLVGSKVVRAYDRAELLEKRHDLMETWGAYACGSGTRGPKRRSSPGRRKNKDQKEKEKED